MSGALPWWSYWTSSSGWGEERRLTRCATRNAVICRGVVEYESSHASTCIHQIKNKWYLSIYVRIFKLNYLLNVLWDWLSDSCCFLAAELLRLCGQVSEWHWCPQPGPKHINMFQYVSMPLRMDDGRFVSAHHLVLTPNAIQTSADWDFEDIMDLLEDSIIRTYLNAGRCWKWILTKSQTAPTAPRVLLESVPDCSCVRISFRILMSSPQLPSKEE